MHENFVKKLNFSINKNQCLLYAYVPTKLHFKFTLLKQHLKNDRIVLKVLKFSNMFRSIFDHPQGDIFSLPQLVKINLSGLC